MVSVTTLVVLAALLSSMKDRIPSTTYFKYIDLWFLWYTCFIFSISVLHVIIHEAGKKMKKTKIAVETKTMFRPGKTNSALDGEKINEMAKKWTLMPFFLFNIIYSALQFKQ